MHRMDVLPNTICGRFIFLSTVKYEIRESKSINKTNKTKTATTTIVTDLALLTQRTNYLVYINKSLIFVSRMCIAHTIRYSLSLNILNLISLDFYS